MGGSGNFDLAGISQFAVTRNQALDGFPDQVQQVAAVRQGEMRALRHQPDHQFVVAPHRFAAPSQVVPDQQISQVLPGKKIQRRLAMRLLVFVKLAQPLVCRVGVDHHGAVTAETTVKNQFTPLGGNAIQRLLA